MASGGSCWTETLREYFLRWKKQGKLCPSYLEESVKEGVASCQMPQQVKGRACDCCYWRLQVFSKKKTSSGTQMRDEVEIWRTYFAELD